MEPNTEQSKDTLKKTFLIAAITFALGIAVCVLCVAGCNEIARRRNSRTPQPPVTVAPEPPPVQSLDTAPYCEPLTPPRPYARLEQPIRARCTVFGNTPGKDSVVKLEIPTGTLLVDGE